MGVKDKRRRLVLKLVEKRSRCHLVPLIGRHVKSGSSIISDQWRAYRRVLRNMGYNHYNINHSRWFVNPQTAVIPNIKGRQRTYREFVGGTKRGSAPDSVANIRCVQTAVLQLPYQSVHVTRPKTTFSH